MISRQTQTEPLVAQRGIASHRAVIQGRPVIQYPKPSANPCVEDFERCCDKCNKILENIAKVVVAAYVLSNPPLLALCGVGYLFYKVS